jgi:cation:H+ antiporter
MEATLHHFIVGLADTHLLLLFGLIGVCLGVLGKSADVLVEEAVLLAQRWGVPTVIIGATLVSLGTTTPEAAISVFAALQGEPGLALGNAVGSVICDTGLILGLAILLGPVPLDQKVVGRQGWIQFGSGVLLVATTVVFGSRLPRAMGFVYLALLGAYLYLSVMWARGAKSESVAEAGADSTALVICKLLVTLLFVVGASHILIPAVEVAALRLGVPEDIIAATLVAFGTSLPELVTAVTAVRKGEGGLAVGNVIGADILNVLFVAGTAAAVTPGGLLAPPTFFKLHFPAMLGILAVFRVGIYLSGDRMRKPFGYLLLGLYGGYLSLQMFLFGGMR